MRSLSLSAFLVLLSLSPSLSRIVSLHHCTVTTTSLTQSPICSARSLSLSLPTRVVVVIVAIYRPSSSTLVYLSIGCHVRRAGVVQPHCVVGLEVEVARSPCTCSFSDIHSSIACPNSCLPILLPAYSVRSMRAASRRPLAYAPCSVAGYEVKVASPANMRQFSSPSGWLMTVYSSPEAPTPMCE